MMIDGEDCYDDDELSLVIDVILYGWKAIVPAGVCSRQGNDRGCTDLTFNEDDDNDVEEEEDGGEVFIK